MSFNGSPYCGQFSSGVGCVSAALSTAIRYRQVCGRVAGYQYHAPDAFFTSSASIDEAFFDGLSIMYGSPRRHIWTYAVGYAGNTVLPGYGIYCPCNTGSGVTAPPYVGSNYYCESGSSVALCQNKVFSNDVLWDGQQCDTIESPCCTHPNMPWFIKTLNETTTEDIELRACTQKTGCDGSGAIFLIEIYML